MIVFWRSKRYFVFSLVYFILGVDVIRLGEVVVVFFGGWKGLVLGRVVGL